MSAGISLTDLPDPSDEQAVRKFAATFDGYKAHGSFQACAAAAREKRRSTVDDLRNELFFAFRAARHTDDDSVLSKTYDQLLPLFRAMLISRK